MRSSTRKALLLAAATLGIANVGLGQVVWNGGADPNLSFSVGGNWVGGNPPGTSGSALVFDGSVGLAPFNDLVDASFDGITFNSGAGSFVVGGNNFSLNGDLTDNEGTNAQTINNAMALTATRTVNVTGGGNLTLGGVVSGTGFGILKTGAGTLRFGANNTFTGNTVIDGGTVAYTADNTAVQQITIGATAQTANIGSLDMSSANVTATGFVVQTYSTTANTLTIGSGKTFAINGGVQIGSPTTPGSSVNTTILAASGAGTLSVSNTNANFLVGVGSGVNGNPGFNAQLDLSNLANFKYDTGASGTGNLYIGFGTRPTGTLRLANTTNAITAVSVVVGNSAQTPGFTNLGTNNNAGGTSNLFLGAGSNVINTNSINIGFTKSVGIIQFQTGTGSVSIAGQTGGTSSANITVGQESSGSGATGLNQILLDGHEAHIQAGNFFIGVNAGSTGASNGAVTFDTGVITADNFQLARHTGSTGPAAGTFTLGGASPNDTATGVLNVNSVFNLANQTTNNSSGTTAGVFVINGGVANINADMVDASTAAGTHTTTLTLAGGKLNMMGHAIGNTGTAISTVNLPAGGQTATLANLGGTGINNAGLNVNGGGTLILAGVNTYTGGTQINSGTLQITGTAGTDAINNNSGNLVFAPSGTIAIPNAINSGSSVSHNGIGETQYATDQTYTGSTEINSGALAVNGQLTSSNVNVNTSGSAAGKLGGAGTLGTVTLAADNGSNVARVAPGASTVDTVIGELKIGTLNVNGGDFRLDLHTGGGDLVHVLGDANFNAPSTISIAPGADSGTYTVFQTDGTVNGTGNLPHLSSPTVGRSTLTLDTTNTHAIKVTVAGSAASLIWKGTQDGVTWNVEDKQNWSNGGVQDKFFQGDDVTFNDSNNGNYNVTLDVSATPGSVTVNNSAGNYTIGGAGGINGATGLAKSGSRTLILATNNTFSGATTISGGTLQLGAGTTTGSVGTGAVSNDGVLAFNRSDALTFDNTISGTGSVVKSGTNQVTLTANDTYTGGTTIASGTLQLSNAGSFGSGNVTNNGAVVFNRADSFTVNNAISGTGSLVKANAGALTLAAVNGYSGSTSVTGGTLSFSASNNLGDASATNTISLAGGALQSNGASVDLGVNRSVTIGTGGGTIDVTSGNVLTLSGQLSGANGLNKVGAGKLILGGDNSASYTGNTLIAGGVVEVSQATNLIASSGTIGFNAGTLHITADMAAPNASNKFTTSVTGANTTTTTATFDVDTNVTFTVGTPGGSAAMRTAGGAAAGGSFIKAGGGTMRILSNNPQLDVAFLLNQGTVIVESSNGLGGADSATANHVDLKNGTNLVLRQDNNTNFLTPIVAADADGAINVIVDRQTDGGDVSHSVNALRSGAAFTANISTGAHVTSGQGSLTVGSMTLGGNGTLNIVNGATAGTTMAVTNGVGGGFALTKTGNGTLLLNGNSTYTGGTNISGGTLISSTNLSNGAILVDNGGFAQVTAKGSPGDSSGTTAVPAMQLNGTGKLDITNNGLVIDYSPGNSPLTTITGYVSAGNLLSSTANNDVSGKTALAVAEASAIGIADGGSFMGKPADASSVVARYTLRGDASMNGVVDSSDFGVLAANFNGTGANWALGDFNGDGKVNAIDFNLLATNYGAPLPAGDVPSASLGALVPEPGAAAMLALGLGMLGSRRRRRV